MTSGESAEDDRSTSRSPTSISEMALTHDKNCRLVIICERMLSSAADWTLIRPRDIVVSGLRFCRDSSIFDERNSTKAGHMLRSECYLKMFVRNLEYPRPLKMAGPKAIFWRLPVYDSERSYLAGRLIG